MMILPPLAALVFTLATITIPSRPDTDAAPPPDAPGGDQTQGLTADQLMELEGLTGEAAPEPEPTPAERRDALDTLYDELAAAPDAEAASRVAPQIEALWESSGSATADLLSDRATQAMAEEDREMAARHLDDALRFAPEFAEGWVRRARLHTLNDEHSEALAALESALEADPRHYRALLSLARTLESMDSVEGAYEAFGEVLTVHPYLPEALEERERLAPQVEGRDL